MGLSLSLGLSLTSATLNKGAGVPQPPEPIPFPTLTGLYLRDDAANPANVGARYSEDFAPSAVNLTTGILTLVAPGFKAFPSYSSASGVPVEFFANGGGSVPVGWDDPSIDYFIWDTGGGACAVVGQNKPGDWVNQPGALASDSLLPAQNFATQTNRIIPTTQGSGTITIRSKANKLISSLANLVAGKSYTTNALDVNDKHTFFEAFADAQGVNYIRSRRLARNNQTGYGSGYNSAGKTYRQGPGSDYLVAGQEVAGKRTIADSFVCLWDGTLDQVVAKSNIPNANVNISTDVFTQPTGTGASSMSLVTGEPARCRLISGTTLPTIAGTNPVTSLPWDLATDTVWPRTSGVTFTLHPTSTDASNNTNKLDVTAAGSGVFQFYAESVPGDGERMRFLIEHLNPGNSATNILSARFNALVPGDVIQIISTDFIVSGTTNGEVGFSGRNAQGAGAANQVYVWFPPGCTVPIRSDNGLAMTSGYYWISLKPGSSAFVRLHDTQAQALAAAGIATNLLTGANACIKFNSGTYTGRCSIKAVNRTFNIDTFAGPSVASPWAIPFRQKGILSVVIDFNNPSKTYVHARLFWNNVKVADYELTGHTKQNTPAAIGGFPAWTDLNSAASHVPWEGARYAKLQQAIDGLIPDSEYIGSGSMHEWAIPEYRIAA